MSAAELLRRLRALGVSLRVDGAELKVSAPKGVLNADLQDQLRAHKAELTELLRIADSSAQSKETTVIPPADRSRPIPLSFAQQRMWFLEEFEDGSSVYNISWAMRLKGAIDKAALQASLNKLVSRHESLRTVFIKTDAEPVQQVLDSQTVVIEESAMSGVDEQGIQSQLESWSQETFDLESGPLLRVRLIELGENDHALMMVIHHIISDAWSLDLLQGEFFGNYLALCQGDAADQDDLPLQFADYAAWQRNFLQGDELQRQLDYWSGKLRGAPPLLELPTDHPRPPEQSYRGARLRRLLPVELREQLKALAKDNNATLFMVLLAAFDVLLARYSGQDDIVVGTPIAGRQQTELEGLIGLFLNTLALRAELNAEQRFSELLEQVQTTALDAYAHQELPFDKLVDAVQPARDMSHSPVFQVQFMLQNAPASGEPLAGLEITPVEFEYGTAKFDITLATGETPDGLMAEMEYATDLFDAVTIERMLEHYERLLRAIVEHPQALVSELPLMGHEDLTLLSQWNDTDVTYPQDATLQTLFEAQVKQTPDATALIFADAELSYAELNERANQLAHWLQANGVETDSMVGVYMERSVEMVVALYGIIKAGGAYVPLDPDYPEQRIEHMLEDADMSLLLTQSHLAGQLPEHSLQLLELDRADLAAYPAANPAVAAGADNLAYAIFTSGSTGRPKGVMNEHHGIVNRLLWMQSEYQLDATDRVLQKTPFSFDVSVWEFFWPLMTGATLVVARPGGHKDSTYLVRTIREHQVTTMHFVPSMLQVFLQDGDAASCHSLKRVICSGEALSHDLQSRFFATYTAAELHNLYGPTEAAIDVTYWACQRDSVDTSVPIGRPVDNTKIYVVEPNGRQAPIGVAGELWIGGAQVARGYAGRPELTAERFIPDPFAEQEDARVYRTGDLVRWRNDGVIEFLGRIDHQVKLRGFRIELGEIEAMLDGMPQVEQSLVLLREDVPGDKRLVAYVTGTDGTAPEVPVLRDKLKNALPEYMVPAAFVALDEFPLLPNGKVDRRALPEPEGRRDVAGEYIAPGNAIEATLAGIWKDLLRVDRVGVSDNFFELGGDSILSIQIISRAAKAGLQLTPRQVFKHQTIAELAAVASAAGSSSAEQGLVSGPVLLTPVQQWFFGQPAVDAQHFNQSTLLECSGVLQVDALEAVFQLLFRHHDALRLKFVQDANGWSQSVAEPGEHRLHTHLDLSGLSVAEQDAQMQVAAGELQASFDLGAGCLLQALSFALGEGRPDRLLIVIHHLAVDGISWRILLEDLEQVYAALTEGAEPELPPKSQSFQAWAQKLQDYANSAAVAGEESYWQMLPWSEVTQLPVDSPGGSNQVASVQTVSVALDEVVTRQLLQEAPQAYRTQINDVLLAALARAVAGWTGGQSVLVDMEGHGREDVLELDVSRTLGWFTTIYPLLLQLPDSSDTATLIKSVKEQVRALPVNGLGFGLLKYMHESSLLHSDPASVPQAQILFNYLGQFDQSFDTGSVFRPAAGVTGPDQSPERLRSHLLDINGSVFEGRLQFGFSYSTNLHSEETIRSVAEQFVAELTKIVEHCITPGNVGYTPADFPLVSLGQAELDDLLAAHQDVEDLYPITPMQHGMLFHSLFLDDDPDETNQVYLTQVIWSLEGKLDEQAFAAAWQEIVWRHTSLRSSFHVADVSEPVAIVHRDPAVSLESEDWRDLEAETQEAQLNYWLNDDQKRGYDLQSAPLMRLFLVRCGENSYRFVWSHHHIIMDGWSIPVVLNELFAIYNARTSGESLSLSPARSYSEYIAWLKEQDTEAAETFWRDTLDGFTAPTPLPAATGIFRGIDANSHFAKCFATLDPAETDQLRELAKRLHLTANTLVQGVWALLISRYTGEDDIVFGATTSGRPADLKGVESIVGLFLNAIPVRARVETDASVQAWMEGIQEQQIAARQHEYASLVDVQGWSDVPRGQPLFNSVLIFENYPDASSLWSDRNALRVVDMQSRGWTSLPLAAAASISSRFVLRLSYDTSCYTQASIEQLVEVFLGMLRTLVGAPEINVGELLMPASRALAEQHEPVPQADFAGFAKPAADTTLVSAFESVAARSPDAHAVNDGVCVWTYSELNARANAVARQLITAGVLPCDRVGLLLGQDAVMLAGLLGALKAGATYVPLDPKAPVVRLATIAGDAGINCIVTDAARRSLADELGAATVLADAAGEQPDNPGIQIAPDAMAYILFTSGSTGTPKGVTQSHQNVLQHVRNYCNEMHIAADDRLSLFAPYGFDAAVMDIYGALLSGACLCPFDMREQLSAEDIRQQLAGRSVTVFHSTPTVYRFLFEQAATARLPAVRLVVLGGEQARLSDLDIFRNRFEAGVSFCNLMGATEFSIASVFFAAHETVVVGRDLPLGRAVEGVEMLLLDETGQPAVLHGELCIRSDHATPGYWNDSELTAAAFLSRPETGPAVYRTGDLCRYTPDGQIVFMGRRDEQIKVRGNRVEPGEVEAALNALPQVERSAVVLSGAATGSEVLAAYFVATAGTEADASELRRSLQERLPDYMVPGAYVQLDEIPLTPNGKLDRRALAAPDQQPDEGRYEAPRTATEEVLTSLWAEVLGLEQVGIHDDFFVLGGHSLLATRLISRVRDRLGNEPGLRLLFSYPTVAEFAARLEDARPAGQAIKAVPHADGAPLSFAQQRLWFLDQLEGDNPAYHMFAPVRMQGDVRLDVLQSAVNDLVARHETLRTTFVERDGEALQLVAPQLHVPLEIIGMPGADDDAVRARLVELVNESYELEQGPLFKIRLLKISADEYVLVILIHHIISDVWSMEVMYRDLLGLYRLHGGLPTDPLPELPIQYADFAIWQRQMLASEESQQQLDYWRERLAGAPAVIDLPVDRPRPQIRTPAGNAVSRFLPADTNEALNELGKQHGATLFMVLQAVFDVLLARYSGQTDVVIGTPVTGRKRSELEGLIGFFLNMLVLRADLDGNPTFAEFLRQVKTSTLEAYANQDLPFEMLVDELKPVRDLSHSPLFQVAFTVVTTAPSPGEFPDLQLEPVTVDFQTAKYDLFMSLTSQPEGLNVHLEYSEDIFDVLTIERMLDHFVALIEGVLADPDAHIAALPILADDERRQLLVEWNDTAIDYSRDVTLAQLFESQAMHSPEAIAVTCEGVSLSYRELDQRANRLAHALRGLGVGPDVLVALYAERSIDMLVSVLGILKSGGAYVPLDPSFPTDRIAYMLEDSAAQVVVTQQGLESQLPQHGARVLCVDALGPVDENDRQPPAGTDVRSDNLAYVIYTSGSTGKPKGVQLAHRSVVNFLTTMADTPGMSATDSLLSVTTLSFDISVLELLLPLSTGAEVVIATRSEAADGYALLRLIEAHDISVMQATPATWRMMLQAGWEKTPGLTVLCGGEALERELAEQLHSRSAAVWNMYGPTETTIWSSCHRFEPGDEVILIGRPIGNTQMYVLDEQLQPVPVGVNGELFIGGDGLARGYRDRDELTAEKFIPDPFSEVPDARIYRTGDLARFRPDGTLQVLGRTDFQVKLRGFRIELGEIEAQLTDHPDVKQAVVTLREDTPGDQRLVGYMTGNGQADATALREHLRGSLPEYMVPSAFMWLDEMPLTPNGKVDRKALPVPEYEAAEYVAPRNDTEDALAAIWSEVLGVEQIGIHDDFFMLGGHSLLATQVISRIRDELNAEPELRLIFSHSTIAAFAAELASSGKAAKAIEPVPHADGAPMSFAQQRLWFLHKMEPGSANYNISGALLLTGELDTDALQAAVDDLVVRHESLRTTFVDHDNKPMQLIAQSLSIQVQQEDCTSLDDAQLRSRVAELAGETFDLENGPLLRVRVLQKAADNNVLFICMHHIISDAWSNGVFIRELAQSYNSRRAQTQPQLPALPIQYADYALWQHEHLDAGELERQIAYWSVKLRDATASLELPTDRPRPAIQTFRGDAVIRAIPNSLVDGLRRLAGEHKATLFMVMLAAVNVLMSRYSGQKDIVIGSPIAGRQRSELENQIGLFINTLALRTDLSGNPTLHELLAQVRQTTLDAYEHQDLPFEKLIEELQPVRDTSRSPLFQVALVLQNAPGTWSEFEGLEVKGFDYAVTAAKFDLTVELMEGPEDLTMAFTYNTDLFDAVTIETMVGHFEALLDSIAVADNPVIGELSLMNAVEQQRLLIEWNDTAADYPSESGIPAIFEQQVAKTPDNTALICAGEALSYKALNERANQLAHFLLNANVQPEDSVAICMDRGIDAVIAILGILKAGGAYVPLDPAYPVDRLNFMLEDCKAGLLLSTSAIEFDLTTDVCHRVNIDATDLASLPATNPELELNGSNLAYLVYTSGSTGRPKGTLIEQRSVLRLVINTDYAQLDEHTRIAMLAPISFDASTLEIWGSLLNGGASVIYPDRTPELTQLRNFLDQNQVNLIFITTSLFNTIIDTDPGMLENVEMVLTGGEAMSISHITRANEQLQNTRFVNVYGPTESTTFTTAFSISKQAPIGRVVPIGKAIANTTVYILDEYLQPVPAGIAGELFIGGDGLSRGYLNQPELTREKFIPNKVVPAGGERLYRTGDLVRYRIDGNIEFVGRVDDQVKIRGFRIELGEIEHQLRDYESVDDAAVIVHEAGTNDKRLVAYAAVGSGHVDEQALNEFLKDRLPRYMVPSVVMQVPVIPKTANGKVDRKALPEPEWRSGGDFEAPVSDSEACLAAIWKGLLKVDQVGRNDNFFDLGGHSLLTIRLVKEVEQATGERLTIADVFENPTLAELSTLLADADWDMNVVGLANAGLFTRMRRVVASLMGRN